MVVETQARLLPPKIKRTLCVVLLFPLAVKTANKMDQTNQAPMLYAQ
jgi:hypothetical protein